MSRTVTMLAAALSPTPPECVKGVLGTSVSAPGPAGPAELEGLWEGPAGDAVWKQHWLNHLRSEHVLGLFLCLRN